MERDLNVLSGDAGAGAGVVFSLPFTRAFVRAYTKRRNERPGW